MSHLDTDTDSTVLISTSKPHSTRRPQITKTYYTRSKKRQGIMSDQESVPLSPTHPSAASMETESSSSSDIALLLKYMVTKDAEYKRDELERQKKEDEFRSHILQMQADLISAQTSRAEEAEKASKGRAELEAKRVEDEINRQERIRIDDIKRQEEMIARKKLESAKEREDAQVRHLKRDAPKFQSKDHMPVFMQRFESLALASNVPLKHWADCFVTCLAGSHLTTWMTIQQTLTAVASYNDIKPRFLTQLGFDRASSTHVVAKCDKPYNMSYDEWLTITSLTWETLFDGCKNVKDCIIMCLKASLINSVHGACKTDLLEKIDSALPTFSKIMSDWESTYKHSSYRHDFRSGYKPYRRFQADKKTNNEKDSSAENNSDSVNVNSISNSSQGSKNIKKDSSVPASPKPTTQSSGHRIVCHHCGVQGHIRPNCPQLNGKPLKVVLYDSDEERYSIVDGTVNGKPCKIELDSGARITVVDPALIDQSMYLDSYVDLNDYSLSHPHSAREAEASISVLGHVIEGRVAVRDLGKPLILLGENNDNIFMPDLLVSARSRYYNRQKKVKAVTRLQAKRVQEDDQNRQALDLLDGALSTPVIVDGETEVPLVDDHNDAGNGEEQESPATAASVEEDIALPSLDENKRELLIQYTLSDDSLTSLRQFADKGLNGYTWDDGLLMHKSDQDDNSSYGRIVVPKEFRPLVLDLAHKFAGHLGIAKVKLLLLPFYTWPGISRDVTNHCLECEECQFNKRNVPKTAPYQTMPVLTVPFEKMAMDIVGPLPRSKHGFRYMLTTICLASKYPEVIAIRDKSAAAVAEGLIEVFSRTGIPRIILSDQGSEFVCKLIRSLCERLGVTHITTSPYHPQSNGCLERLHGTLVPMIRKALTDKLSWPAHIKYALFALRAMPARDSGFSPFEIVFGKKFPSPLSLLFDSWKDTTSNPVKLTQWLEQFEKRVQSVRECLHMRLEAIRQENEKLQSQKKLRLFKEGDQVLLRVAGLSDKLAQAWDGPFVVKKRIGLANYELDLGTRGRKSRATVVHVNNIKEWHPRHLSIHKVVYAQDDGMDEQTPSVILVERELTSEQSHHLTNLQSKYADNFTNTPGTADVSCFSINTGNHKPVAKPPYRIPDKWKNELRTHTQDLLDLGVIRPSTSPWCSSSVTVGKKDGTLRLCQDYRPLNSITVADPYMMRRIDDTLDQLGESSYLTKLDLSKGYYQIPVDVADIPKTAFSTPLGKFEYTRMPFGLRNAPAHFQRCMDNVLAHLYDCSSAYIDDVIIFSRSWEDHLLHLDSVLFALCSKGFTIKPSKCVWAAKSIEYLGFEVGEGKLSVPQARVRSIQAITQPHTVKQLRSFLGTIGYYRRFVPQFSTHSAELTPATKKNQPNVIHWTPTMLSSFHYLRNSLSDVLCTFIPTSHDVYQLITDASGKGIGSVLCVIRYNMSLPVAFQSRQLRERERAYSASELEGLAVVEAVRYFEIHLFGRNFTVVTDHRALTHLFSSSVLNSKLWRWALYLQQFSISFQYLPGRFNQVADCLSRQEWPTVMTEVESVPISNVIRTSTESSPPATSISMDAVSLSSSLPEAGLVSGSPKKKIEILQPRRRTSSWPGGHVGGASHTHNSPT